MSEVASVDLELDNQLRLETLAEEANASHRLAESSAKTALEHARDAGLWLTEAKSRCKHGEWLKWLEENFEGTRLNAWRYMRISDKWEEISNVSQPEHLGVRKALELLSEPREAEEPEIEPAEVTPSPEVLLRRVESFKEPRITALFKSHEITVESAVLLGHIKNRGMSETLAALLEHGSDEAKVRQSKAQLEHLLKQNEHGQTDEQTAELVRMVEGGEADSVFDAHRIRQDERKQSRDEAVKQVARKAAQDLAGHDKDLDPKETADVERIALELAEGEGWDDLDEAEQITFIQNQAGEEHAATVKSSRPKPKADVDEQDEVKVKRGLLLSLKQLARYAPIQQRQAHMSTWNDKL